MRTTTDDHDEDVAGTAALARLKEEIETIGDLIADSVAVLEAEDVKTGLRHMKAACKRSLLADLGLPRDIRKFSDLLCRQATTRLSQAPLSVRHSAAEHFTRYIVHDLYTSVANRLMDELDEGRPARISDATVREIADTALKSAPQALVRLAFACGWCIAPFMAVPLLRALMIDERLALGSWAPFAEGVMAMANAEENALIENFVAINDSLSEGPDIEDDHVLSGVDREDPEEVVPEALDDGELASRVEEARSGLTAIEQALAEAAEALADDRPPDMDVVRVLFEARTAFDTAAELLGLVPPPPINMALLEAAFSARLGVASIREALARLAAASGPPIIGAALEVLAVEAARLLETPAWSEIDMLRATHLARLVELGDASARRDDEAVFRLDAELREALEEAARPVVLVASQGRLILPTDLPRQHGSLAGRSDAPDSRSGDEVRAGGALEDGSEPAESALDRVTSTDGSPIAGEPLSDPLDGGGLVRRGELDTEADALGTDTELLGQKADAETTFRLERPLTVSGHQELEDALEVAASAEVTAAEDGASPDTQSSPASEVPISRRETPASEESVASADGSPTPMPPGVTHPIDAELGRLLGESRFSVAAWLAEAAEQAPGRVNAFRAAALAEALRSSTGEVIAELNAIAGQLSRHDLEGDRIAQLLALVAAIRSVLLVPRSSMLSVVSDLGEIFATEPGIAEIASAASRAATRGLSLTGELLPGVQDVTEIEGRIRKTSLVAKAELSTPRTMRFARATRIWKQIIDAEGVVGQLLAHVAGNESGKHEDVSNKILTLRARHDIEAVIDDLDRKLRGNGSKRIEGPVRGQLVDRVVECVDIAADWVKLIDQLEAKRNQAQDWRQAPLAELRATVSAHRERVLTSLTSVGKSADPLLSGAAAGAAESLKSTFFLMDGIPLPGSEPPLAHILNSDLLKAPEIAMGERLGVIDPGAVSVSAVLGAANRTWIAGFEARCKAQAFGEAQAIIERVALDNPSEARVLETLRDERLEAARVHVGIDATRVRAELDTARRRGFLDEDTWRDLTVMLDKAAVSERVDLGAVAREISAVADRCAQGRALGLVEFNEEYEIKRHIPGVAERLDEIDRLIALDDLATARDLIARAEVGDAPPTVEETSRSLAEFFPAVPNALAGGLNQGQVSTVTAGGTTAGVDFLGLSAGERTVAERGLQAWYDVANKARVSSWGVPLAPALRILGIDAESSRNAPLPSAADRRWVDLVGVRRTGKALVPAFGSATRDELRLLLCWNSPEVTTLLGWIAQDASEKPVAVLYFATLSPERRITLATALRERRERPVVVIDDAAILYLAAYGASSFDSAMRLVLPFSAVNPYEPFAAGDVPLEMFYGRSVERSSIMDQRGTSLIYGGRQLGKSALLRSAAGRFEQTNGYKALYVTLQRAPIATTKRPEALWDVLKEALDNTDFTTKRLPKKDSAAVVEELIEDWLNADPNRRLLLLLDECDDFFDADSERGFSQTARLRDLMVRNNRRVKAVFAGLHQVQRFASIPNQPLAHLGQPQVIGPLAPQPAFDLLHDPFEALGFRLDEDQAARLMANANYQPLALQLYGRALLALMLDKAVSSSMPVDVTNTDVDAVLADSHLDEQIRQRFELTLRLDPRYRVIAYAVAHRAQESGHDSALSTRELRNECETWWREGFSQLGPDEFRSLVEEMVGLGVLATVPGGWRMRSPNVLRMLGGIEQVEEALCEAESQAAPAGLFSAETRRLLDVDTGRRSPLTEAQLAELVSATSGSTHVVLGSQACGIENVLDALASTTTDDSRAQLHVARSKAAYQSLLKGGDPGEYRIVVSVLEAKDETCEAALGAALTTPPAGKATRSVVLVAGSGNLGWWPSVLERPGDDVSITELRRHSARSLWAWAVEVPTAFQDEKSREKLLAITGGWPLLVDRAAQHAHQGYSQPEIFAALEAELATPEGAATLVDGVGLEGDTELAALWTMIAELVDDPVDAGELAALAEAHAHPAGAVSTLRALGILGVTPTGLLFPEPVFREAWRSRAL